MSYNCDFSPSHFVVIGIDFGTTFSGVSWTWSKATNINNIEPVHRWDVDEGSARNQESDKVPTKICYDSNGQVLKWGYRVTPRDQNQVEWFKLLLSKEAKDGPKVKKTRAVLERLGKTAVDVVADYLRCLWKHAIEVIELALSKVAVDNMTFRVVLTLPANWDHRAQRLTVQAAVQAGITIPRSQGPTFFKTVSEPEAAALAAWHESGMRWRPDLQLNDNFVVCDAGGGTVDLISYTVTSLDPLKLEMCVEPTGDLCGAVYLDEAFDNTMRTVVGQTYDRLDPEVKAKVFENDWEYAAKRIYNGKAGRQFSVDIPGYKPKKSLFGKRASSTITLDSSHMAAIFQPVVSGIVDLVRNQIKEIEEEKSTRPKAVLLVGGFGENNFVLEQLKHTFPVPIQRPTKAWGVISRGAVIKGLSTSAETETVTNFVSKLNYGMLWDEIFDSNAHEDADKYMCPLWGLMARNQCVWYLQRGERVNKLEAVKHAYRYRIRRRSDLANVHSTVWVSGLKVPPKRKSSDSQKLCTIRCNFDEEIFEKLEEKTGIDGHTKFRELRYTIKMTVTAEGLDWVVFWRDQQKGRGQHTVEYELDDIS